MITSPYNFVPLSEKVVSPFWAKHVSHDMPFENGISGVLKLKITAKSPIYVRNGVFDKDQNDENEKNRFNHFNNKPFIPASSIKGMLRSVVEIMSFGRMANKVNDDRYSVRDFQNNDIYPILDLTKTISCGWLKKDVHGEYFLQDCGVPGRISHEAIDIEFKTDMSPFFKNQANVRPNSKSALFKYTKFPTVKGAKLFSKEDSKEKKDEKAKVDTRYICKFDPMGKKGTIVLTGQPGHRYFNERKRPKPGWDGKHLEFVFFERSTPFEKVPDSVIKNFFFAYYDHDLNQQKEDWKKLRKPELEKGQPIPVFFRKNSDGSIKDMGLSFLYKITYEQSIVESINNTQGKAESYDLAETIFGYTEGDNALKGRVHIGHAFLKEPIQPLQIKSEVLSGPKASYYPSYVEQDGKDGIVRRYATFMDSSAKIRGWKRYPVRHNGIIHNPGTDNVVTKFIPLNEGVEFTFDIHYHNLRAEELGALMSAITFHNTEGLHHSLGMAKPLGYGKIALSIENVEDVHKNYLKAYEAFMDCELNNSTPNWFKTPQIKELFAMAKGSPNAATDDNLKYMQLTDFVNQKGRKQTDPKNALRAFSNIANNNILVQSLITASDIEATKVKLEKEKKRFSILQNKDGLKKQTKSETEEALKTQFEEKKKALIAFLTTKQQEQKEKETRQLEEEQKRKKQERSEMGSQTDLLFSNFDYEKVADVVKNHLKKYKVEELTETQKEQLMEALTTSYQSIKNPKKDVWLKKDNKFNQFPWTDIRKWLGENNAQVLHSQLVG